MEGMNVAQRCSDTCSSVEYDLTGPKNNKTIVCVACGKKAPLGTHATQITHLNGVPLVHSCRYCDGDMRAPVGSMGACIRSGECVIAAASVVVFESAEA